MLEELLAGRTDKDIAADLAISRYTASQHVRAIFRKFGVASRSELRAMFVAKERRPAPVSGAFGSKQPTRRSIEPG